MKKDYTFGMLQVFRSFKTAFFSIFFLFFVSNVAIAQGPGCPNVDAGPDIELDCGIDCVDLTASFLQTGETTSYEVTSIDYAPPFPFTGGTPVSANTDDVWSPIIPIPFDFCFFGETYSEMIIGSNGVVAFDFTQSDTQPLGFCQWSFEPNETIPDPVELFRTTIFGAYMDINPAVAGSGQINFEVFGEAPCRTMVINFPEVPYFSCTNLIMTSQIVMYETTNVIEVYIEERSDQCPTWNDGLAIIGIQNQDGTVGFTPPDRNTGNWQANEEAWRFTPNGTSNVMFSWLDAQGNVLGTDTTINVCPDDQVSEYTAQAVYTNCNGDVITETDTVTVTKIANFTLDLGGDQSLCDVASYDITADVQGIDPSLATYLWNTGETTQTITVTQSGTYSCEVTYEDCTLTDSALIELNESPIIDLGDDFGTCFDGTIILDASPSNFDPAEATYEWSLNGIVLSGETSPTLVVIEVGTYSVFVTVGTCTSNDTIVITPRTDLEVSLGDDFKSCPNEPQTLTAETSETDVTFQWLLNEEVLEGETGNTLEFMLEEGVMGIQTYTVIITKGDCTGSDEIDIETYDIGNCVISQGISPNGSPGFNDELDLEFLSDRAGGILQLQIFNRLGGLVYQKSNYLNEWVGQSDDGNELPTGTYFYVIDLASEDSVYGMQATGWIYLNRDAN
ncbi:MAG: gliding motility-associated C-terminal domain-containing protein [Flavobacteriaceae bacterium]|nr:gliding motility-associated C-terminal domain-containing protein [Flavobacteriaceae bacterium]